MESIPFPLARETASAAADDLSLDAATFRRLFATFGPSLALWRGAEIAALRSCALPRPVLDLGCGDGYVTSMVLPAVDLGVDPWPVAVERASASGMYRSIHACPIQAASIPDGSVRTIVSNSVLEHVADIDAVLAAAARLLAPAGRIVFTVPTEAFGAWLLVPSSRYASWRNKAYEHRNLWTVDEWTRRLRRAGLEVECVRSYLRRSLVALWDALELAQRVWIGRWRVAGVVWKRLPAILVANLARLASRLDLSSPPPGGGRLIVARRM